MPETREELLALSMGGPDNMTHDVVYDVKDIGEVRELTVTRCKNGIVANFDDIYMRRRDPDAMIIGDDHPTDKDTHESRFGVPFDDIRDATFDWLASQKQLLVMPFYSGNSKLHLGYASLLVMPANAAVFALAMADIQGFIPKSELPNMFRPKAVIYVAPPFRHLYYDGKQVVVHNRVFDMHEIFSYNLYPGPSAKKGIYSVLLNIGEQEGWVTLHASAVRVITPYELMFTILHEGASGAGKSEMTQPFHRQSDGRLLLAENITNGDKVLLSVVDSSELHPIVDDMALCHPRLTEPDRSRLVVADAEDGWFMRVDHINKYGTEPELERNVIHPPKPLVFLNMEAIPGATVLPWEPVMDTPEKPCPNPRVIIPREFIHNHVDEAVEIHVRSFGIRTPPCTKEKPSYGIVGMFHVLPPALAWLWRLAAPRGYANPSIISTEELTSEGVGSYWPFATGKMVDQANLLLDQIQKTLSTRYVLVPNQYIGAYKTGFAGQWITREVLARRGGMHFRDGILQPSRCPLLGYAIETLKVDGQPIPKYLFQVNHQPEVCNEGYDAGAKMLAAFFKKEIRKYLVPDLKPLGKRIIDSCLNDARVVDFYNFIPKL
jgi:hypothetical protein